MRLVTIDRCTAGLIIGKSIYNDQGKVLLSKGIELTDILIKKLEKNYITTIYIEDELSEGIEIVESIPEELLVEAGTIITESLPLIASINGKKSNVQGMMKSGRAMRSLQKIFKDISISLKESQQVLNLLATTKIQENYVYTHSLNVSIYACQLAIELGLPLKKIEEIGLGAMLHDIGKLNLPTELLHKPEKLTSDEYELIKSHSEIGFNIIRKFHEIPLTVAHCAFQHHEQVDGKGYPRGLKEDQIHQYAKIISVADVFDAVTSKRSYRSSAMLPHQGLELLYAKSGSHFDRNIVNSFAKCIAIYPQGLTVKLNDGRTGIVSAFNNSAAGRPMVRIIKDEEQAEITPYEIDLSSSDYMTVEIVEADALL